jgi:HSP20 family protein
VLTDEEDSMKGEILGIGVGNEMMSSPHFCIMPAATLEITSPHLCIMASEAMEMFREPLMNIKASGAHFVIELEMPGVVRDSIQLALSGRTLVVEGKVKATARAAEYTHVESASKLFHKEFDLPEDCDRDKLTSSFADGILEIRIPHRDVTKTFKVG